MECQILGYFQEHRVYITPEDEYKQNHIIIDRDNGSDTEDIFTGRKITSAILKDGWLSFYWFSVDSICLELAFLKYDRYSRCFSLNTAFITIAEFADVYNPQIDILRQKILVLGGNQCYFLESLYSTSLTTSKNDLDIEEFRI